MYGYSTYKNTYTKLFTIVRGFKLPDIPYKNIIKCVSKKNTILSVPTKNRSYYSKLYKYYVLVSLTTFEHFTKVHYSHTTNYIVCRNGKIKITNPTKYFYS